MIPIFGLFNFGGGELILTLAIVLILFGAKKLPELAKGLGQGIKEFRKATQSASEDIREAMTESPAIVPKRLTPATIVPTHPEAAVSGAPRAQ
jgi:sec-independent protein translocase protein TatA